MDFENGSVGDLMRWGISMAKYMLFTLTVIAVVAVGSFVIYASK